MNASIGCKLGNYRLVRLLGHGGFADVYLGEHVYLKTHAAIKVLRTQLYDEAQRNFLAEARTIARLDHTNIVRILDFGMDYETPFLVMSYASQGSLRRRHAIGSVLAPPTIVSYVKQVAAALQYAHEQKIIHRDVKPENMLLSNKNTLLLSDFGLAIIVHTMYSASTQSVVNLEGARTAGTATYMAPEQFDGEPCLASDQYALGVVAYEWFCGAPPFNGPDLGIAVRHLYAKPPSMRERIPTLDPAIEQVIMKALEKDPQKRFTTVQDFADALEVACADAPSDPYPLTGEFAAMVVAEGNNDLLQENRNLFAQHRHYDSPPQLLLDDLPSLPVSLSAPMHSAQDLLVASSPEDLPDTESTRIEENIASFPVFLESQPVHSQLPALTPDIFPIEQIKSNEWAEKRKRHWLLAVIILLCLSGIVAVLLFPLGGLFVPTNTLPSKRQVQTVVIKQPGAKSTPSVVSSTQTAQPGQKQSSSAIATPLPTPSQAGAATTNSGAQGTATSAQSGNSPTATPAMMPTSPAVTPTTVAVSTSTFTVTPNNFNTSNCSSSGNSSYLCTTTLVNQSQQSVLTWNAYAFGTNVSAAFNPSSGTLGPGVSQQITIAVSSPCPVNGLFSLGGKFNSSSADTFVSAPWNC